MSPLGTSGSTTSRVAEFCSRTEAATNSTPARLPLAAPVGQRQPPPVASFTWLRRLICGCAHREDRNAGRSPTSAFASARRRGSLLLSRASTSFDSVADIGSPPVHSRGRTRRRLPADDRPDPGRGAFPRKRVRRPALTRANLELSAPGCRALAFGLSRLALARPRWRARNSWSCQLAGARRGLRASSSGPGRSSGSRPWPASRALSYDT
jgi:hypothetical protein